MKKFWSLIAMFVVCTPALAATPATGRGRASMSGHNEGRTAASKKYINNTAVTTNTVTATVPEAGETVSVESTEEVKPVEKPKDMREREKAACIQNNIGVGATFVWASRYSNTANYNSMVEDVEFPENNVCFVKVGLKSNDARIDVSDIQPKYFVMGENITCGQWADSESLKQRILDAKKKGRTWATVGGVVGGAGVGVGAMELFGNKMIGGAVEGQAALDGDELLCAQMKVLKQEKSSKYNDIKSALEELKKYCSDTELWVGTAKPATCTNYNYDYLLGC